MRGFPWQIIPIIALTGAWYSAISERDSLRSELAAAQEASVQRDESIRKLAHDYKEKFDAIDARPAPAVERVFIKADCVPASSTTGVDDGTLTGRVELDPGSVRRVTGVTSRWQKKFEQCSIKLEAIHEAIRTQ